MATGNAVRVLAGAHKHKICSLVVSPNGKLAASGSTDGSITLWDLGEAKALATFAGHHAPVWSLDFDRYGSLLASGSADSTVSLWDSTSMNGENTTVVPPLRQYETKNTPVYNVHFSRTNLLFAMAEFTSS